MLLYRKNLILLHILTCIQTTEYLERSGRQDKFNMETIECGYCPIVEPTQIQSQ